MYRNIIEMNVVTNMRYCNKRNRYYLRSTANN